MLNCCPGMWGEEAVARVQGASEVMVAALGETVSVGQEGRAVLWGEALTVCGDEG